MTLRDDDRALAFGIFDVMILGLGTFGLVFAVLYVPISELFALSNSAGLTGDAAAGAGYTQSAFRYLPFFAIAIAVFALIARAVAERRLV